MAANDALRLHIIIAAYERVTRGSYARGMLTQKEINKMEVDWIVGID